MDARKRNTFLILGLALIALLTFSLYDYFKQQRASAFAEVRFGLIPIADAAPLFVAIEKGYLKEEGVEPKLVTIRGGALIINAIKAGEVDVGFSNTMSFILARSQGIDLVSLGGVAVNDQEHKEGAILVGPDSDIASVQDLSGRSIAINSSRNIVELSLRKLLKSKGVEPSGVRFIEVPFPKMGTVLKSGQVDAISVAEPFWTLAVKHGNGKEIGYYFGDVYQRIEIAAWFALNGWIKGHPRVANAVMNALRRASDFSRDPKNENVVREIIAKYTKLEVGVASAMRLPTFESQLTEDWLTTLMKEMIAEGFLKTPVNMTGAILQ